MMHHSCHYRFASASLKEHRLCHDVFNAAGEYIGLAADKATEWASDGMQWLEHHSSDTYKRLRTAYVEAAYSEEAKERELQEISEFARVAPEPLMNQIDTAIRNGEKPSLHQIAELCKHETWMEIFSDTTNDIFDLAVSPINASVTVLNGPRDLLLSLDEEGRKELYFKYAESLIRTDVR